MTTPALPPSLPVQQPPPLEAQRLPRHYYVIAVGGIMVSTVAATAAVIGAKATNAVRDSSVIQQEDLQRNREFLRATCENTRAVTERFTTHSPAPCPTDFP